MTGRRFDLMDSANLESRDGGITKGALVRNGFAEVDGEREKWMWQRPALATGTAAPLTGKALGLYLASGTLYAMYATSTSGGTAASYSVPPFYRGTSSGTGTLYSFTLTAGSYGLAGTAVFGWFGLAGPPAIGGLVPSTWGTVVVTQLWSNLAVGTILTELDITAQVPLNFYTYMNIGTTTLRMSTASYMNLSTTGTTTTCNGWKWPNVGLVSAVGIYTGGVR